MLGRLPEEVLEGLTAKAELFLHLSRIQPIRQGPKDRGPAACFFPVPVQD